MPDGMIGEGPSPKWMEIRNNPGEKIDKDGSIAYHMSRNPEIIIKSLPDKDKQLGRALDRGEYY